MTDASAHASLRQVAVNFANPSRAKDCTDIAVGADEKNVAGRWRIGGQELPFKVGQVATFTDSMDVQVRPAC